MVKKQRELVKIIMAVILVVIITTSTVIYLQYRNADENAYTFTLSYPVSYNNSDYYIQFTVNNQQYQLLERSHVSNPGSEYLSFYVSNGYSSTIFPVYGAIVLSGSDNPIVGFPSQYIIEGTLLAIFLKENPSLIMNKTAFESLYNAPYSAYKNVFRQEGEIFAITLLNSATTIASSISDLMGVIRGYNAMDLQDEIKNMIMLISDSLEGSLGLTLHYGSDNTSRMEAVLLPSGFALGSTFTSSDAVGAFLSLQKSDYNQFLSNLYFANYGTTPSEEALNVSALFFSNLVGDISSTGLELFLSVSGYLLDSYPLQLALETSGWELLGGLFEFSIPLALAAAILSYFGHRLQPYADYLDQEKKIEFEVYTTLMNNLLSEKAHLSTHGQFLFSKKIPNISDTIVLLYNYALMLGMTRLWYTVDSQYLQNTNPNSASILRDNSMADSLLSAQYKLLQIVKNSSLVASSINPYA